MKATLSFGMLYRMVEKPEVDAARGERIRYVRKELLKLDSQEQFAGLLSRHTGEPLTRGAVGNWELGKPIGVKFLKGIADMAHIDLNWLAFNSGKRPKGRGRANTVPLVGYVGAGAATHFLPAGELGDVEAPDGATETTVAVEIRGDSLGSFFDRWLVFYDDVRRPITPDLIGRLCVVGLADERVLIKKPQKSRAKGLYHLFSQTEDPILDVAIEWAARVKSMVPR